LFLDPELTATEINQRLQQEGLAPVPAEALQPEVAKTGTIAYGILTAH